MKKIIGLAVTIGVLFCANYLFPLHVMATDEMGLLVAGCVLWAANLLVKPILKVLSFPITILTLGLFSLVVSGLMVWLTAYLVPGFGVNSFLTAVLLSLAVSLINSLINE